MSRPINSLRVVEQGPGYTLLSVVWLWHGAAIEERFLVGSN